MITFQTHNNMKVAITEDDSLIISTVQDALDLIGEAGMEDCNRVIVYEENIHADFFRLQTGLAGEILQKFSNYRFKLAVIGDFSKYRSRSLRDFIRESNKGNRIFFVEDLNTALNKLTGSTL